MQGCVLSEIVLHKHVIAKSIVINHAHMSPSIPG